MKQKITFIILFVLASFLVSAQGVVEDSTLNNQALEPAQREIDSLQRLINSTTPIGVKSKLYFDISEKYQNYDSVLKYRIMSLKMEEKMHLEENERQYASERHRLNIFILWLSVGLTVTIVMISLVFNMLRLKRKSNIALAESNAKLEEQKTQIQAQYDKLEQQSQLLTKQKKLLEAAQADIMGSINYGCRIQQAALSTKAELKERFRDCFVFYRPASIVSGDFYDTENLGGYTVMVVADCTGHGIPGAFLSMLGIAALKAYFRTEEDALNPGAVLDKIRNFIKNTLIGEDKIKLSDGMDMTVCTFDKENNKLYYATANQRFIVVHNDEITLLKGDNMPVGRYRKDTEPFQTKTTEIYEGDMVYMFSDGIQDQFGHESEEHRDHKFSIGRLSDVLLANAKLPCDKQLQLFEKVIDDWKGEVTQIDDMTLVGIRV